MKKQARSKKQMQNVNFKSVDEFMEFLSGEELRITEILRALVLECVPDVKEKLSFNVPFYKRKRGICFIWPGSIFWGKSGHQGVRFGFQQGHRLADEDEYLDRGNRKHIYWRDLLSSKEIDPELIRSFLYEAVEIDSAPLVKLATKKKK
jgi:hypothetical protein